jgi:cytoskeletal protein CcmA (bactofilin family)
MFRNTSNDREREPSIVEEPPRTGKKGSSSESATHIAPGAKLQGDLKVNGNVQISGTLEGTIQSKGDVEIGAEGSLKADVSGRNVTVAGTVKGKIYAQERVLLLQGSHVEGDVHAQSLKIEDGVFFQGNCVMGESARTAHPETKVLELHPVNEKAAAVAKG